MSSMQKIIGELSCALIDEKKNTCLGPLGHLHLRPKTTIDICGCKCSLFDLSGDTKMRPLWERYYSDKDAIIYVANASDDSLENVRQSKTEFVSFCQNEVISKRLKQGLPLLIFANQLDVAYGEYEKAVEKANEVDRKRQVSWNSEEEDAFVGNEQQIRTV